MTEPITTNTVFKALAHPYRRYALERLVECDSKPLAELADEVAASACGTPIDDIAEQDREQVFASLFHAHVPLLAAADMVDYDRSEATVALGEAAEQAMPFLSLADDGAAKPAQSS